MSDSQFAALLFLQLAFILAVCRGVGLLAKRVGQPQAVELQKTIDPVTTSLVPLTVEPA